MTVQLELWHLILLLLAFFGAVGGFGKVVLEQIDKRLNERFAGLERVREEGDKRLDERFAGMKRAHQEGDRRWDERLAGIERRQTNLERELLREYVRREDAIRSETVINAKLDALAAKFDLVWGRCRARAERAPDPRCGNNDEVAG